MSHTFIHAMRKNQKAILAVVGVLCMFAFVFVPMLDLFMDDGSRDNPVVASTRYGKINEIEISRMVQMRRQLNMFLGNAMAMGQGMNFVVPNPLGPDDEKTVVETMLSARKAEELGMAVSDSAINDFLREITRNRVKADDLRGLLANIKMSQGQLFEGLRQELMAARLTQLALSPALAEAAPPGERWDYYQRLNRRLNAEVVPVRVTDFTGQVDDPKPTELAEFFDNHKEKYWEPGSPEPGFHQPARARFEYLKADFEGFAKPDSITDDDVKAEYEKNKDQRYRYSGLTETEPAEPEKTEADNAEKPEGEAPAETPAAETPAAEQPPATEPEASETPAAEAPAEGEPASTEPPSQPQGGGGDDAATSDDPALDPTTIPTTPPADEPAVDTNLATDEDPASGGNAVSEDPEAPAADTTPAANAAPAADTTPAADATPATSTPPAAAIDPAAAGAGASLPVLPVTIDSDLMLTRDVTSGPDPKYDPLWKVEARIREELARDRATEQMQTLLRGIQLKLSAYGRARDDWRVTNESKPEAERKPAPTPPSFEEIAKANGLSAHRTELISAREANMGTDLGKSLTNSESFDSLAYGSLRVYMPIVSQDEEGNSYLYWKTEQTPDHVPTLDEVKDEVVLAWKSIKARTLAEAKANTLAKQANADRTKPLKEVLGTDGATTVETGPFTWLTFGTVQSFAPNSPPRLSEVAGVEEPGAAFMERVFMLEPQETGVARNNPESVFYVVRATTYENSTDYLHATFMADDYARYQMAAYDEIRSVRDRWSAELAADAGLSWTRPANSMTDE